MYCLPAGSKCLIRKRGESELKKHTTKRFLAWESYVEKWEVGYIFWYGDYEIVARSEVVAERVFHREGPKHIGELLAKSELLK